MRFRVAYLCGEGSSIRDEGTSGVETVDADDHGDAIDKVRALLAERTIGKRGWFQVLGAHEDNNGEPPVDDGPADNYGAW